MKQLLALMCAFGAFAAPAAADNATSTFATQNNGCLGGLRSAIARGDLAGFSAAFNPGGHFGTVGEAAFLQSHGVTNLSAFCAQFAK
jgi:hypothetical protein